MQKEGCQPSKSEACRHTPPLPHTHTHTQGRAGAGGVWDHHLNWEGCQPSKGEACMHTCTTHTHTHTQGRALEGAGVIIQTGKDVNHLKVKVRPARIPAHTHTHTHTHTGIGLEGAGVIVKNRKGCQPSKCEAGTHTVLGQTDRQTDGKQHFPFQ